MWLRPSLIWSIREPDVQATLQNFVVCFVQNRRGPGGTFETHSQRDLWYFCPVIDYRRAKRAVRAWDLIASNVFALITSRRHLRRLWRCIPPGLWFTLLLLSHNFVDFIYCCLYPFYELSITSSLKVTSISNISKNPSRNSAIRQWSSSSTCKQELNVHMRLFVQSQRPHFFYVSNLKLGALFRVFLTYSNHTRICWHKWH